MSTLSLLDPAFGDSVESALRRFLAVPAMLSPDAPQLTMRMDVTEAEQAYTVDVELPGVRKEDISVQVDGDVVRIEAQTHSDKEARGNGDRLLRSERRWGSMSRSFSLGQAIDASAVEATYADGVLTLKLPKRSPSQAARITVR